ncbi:unnamed protein product [Malus baccata var. baccata]
MVLHELAQKPPHRLLAEKFIALLQSCMAMKQLHQIQTQIIAHGFSHNEYIAPKIVSACAELKQMAYAHKVFDEIPDPNVALWNAMFRGYGKNESHREVIVLFSRMKSMGILPNCFTFPVVIKSCGKMKRLVEGEMVHCVVIKCGFRANPYVGTTLIEMYAAAGLIGAAYKVFGEMFERNVVAWTSIINGYILCGDMACERLFEEMPERNVFSWNGLIGGYARNGRFFETLGSFKRMLSEGDFLPNDATLVTVLSACARLGALDLGKWLHVYAESIGYKRNVYVGNALIDMYAKCGIIDKALDVFTSMDKKDLISWNTIICGLAMHGCGADALNLFSQMKNCGGKPDAITFVAILCSCTHLGLVEDGLLYFQSMVDDYSIVPQIEHYGCMVDLLGRSGLLDQAMNFVRKMPMEADAVIWAALLGACWIYKKIDLAELALERLIKLEPQNPANYVMLSNIYGDLGRWKDVARLKVSMRDTGHKKFPGVSLIEVNDGVVEFYSLDKRHPETEEIYGALMGLTKLLRSSGYVPNILELGQGAYHD